MAATVQELDMSERLKASLKQVAASAGASMIPVVDGPVPPPAKEILPQLTDLISDPKDKLNLIRLIQVDLEWRSKEQEAKKARKPLIAKMKSILGKWSVGRCGWDGNIVNYYGGGRNSLSRDKLIVALAATGMQPNIINSVLQAATTVSTTYTLRITAAGEEEGDE